MKPLVPHESHYIELSPALWRRIQTQAEQDGVSPTKYIENLVTYHTKAPKGSPWAESLPWEVEKGYIQDIIQFYEEDLKDPKPSFASAQEMLDDMRCRT